LLDQIRDPAVPQIHSRHDRHLGIAKVVHHAQRLLARRAGCGTRRYVLERRGMLGHRRRAGRRLFRRRRRAAGVEGAHTIAPFRPGCEVVIDEAGPVGIDQRHARELPLVRALLDLEAILVVTVIVPVELDGEWGYRPRHEPRRRRRRRIGLGWSTDRDLLGRRRVEQVAPPRDRGGAVAIGGVGKSVLNGAAVGPLVLEALPEEKEFLAPRFRGALDPNSVDRLAGSGVRRHANQHGPARRHGQSRRLQPASSRQLRRQGPWCRLGGGRDRGDGRGGRHARLVRRQQEQPSQHGHHRTRPPCSIVHPHPLAYRLAPAPTTGSADDSP